MRLVKGILFAGLALVVLISACAPTATAEPPTPTLVTFQPSDTPPPTLVQIKLSGPVAGTVVSWVDSSSIVYIPAGETVIGADNTEYPRHGVSLSSYWIQRAKVTNRMYALCVGVGVCTPPKPEVGAANYTDPTYADHPVVGVNWDQAQAYCGWIGGRLPTEAEWENAARGPSGQTFPWGRAEPSCELLNFNNCEGATTSVMAYPNSASPYGVLDMAGNVFEWVFDWYDANYYNNSPIQDPPGPDAGLYKVTRGSSFESEPGQIPSAIRHFLAPSYSRRDTGFRCVVQQPINFPPYCQASAYQPTSAIPAASSCDPPDYMLSGYGCQVDKGFSSVDLPLGTIYTMETPGFTCVETFTQGILRVTCYGPDNSTGKMTVCNPACGDPTPLPNTGAVCDPGYTYDPATRQCLYTPILGSLGPLGCPPGYAIDFTGLTCRPNPGLDNQCPIGQYFDMLFGGCAPANLQAGCNLYGLDNQALAQTCYPGCLAGFSYNSASQCCQAPSVGLYPDCQPGFTYDPVFGGCRPGLAQVSGSGCTTVSLDILQCGEPYPCGQITTETKCIRYGVYGCTWDDKNNVCVNEK
ncbi:MAG: formylglycine-generating enzyme family protein [Chloroflexota bacterium]